MLFIPETIAVGYDKRMDTYNGKLSYITYYDRKGKMKKEKSWNNWRDHQLAPDDFENVPTEGFVLNKKVGGYSSGWNYRQSYIRVYDPRGFEFEITVDNLIYILECTNCIKGKGLEGKFIYAWDEKDLVLLPCTSTDYKEIQKYNEFIRADIKLSAKNIVIGATYKTVDLDDVIYLGRYNMYNHSYGYKEAYRPFLDTKDKGKTYHFYNLSTESFEQISSLKKIKGIVDETPSELTSMYQEQLWEQHCMYDIDNDNLKKITVTAELLQKEIMKNRNNRLYLYDDQLKAKYVIQMYEGHVPDSVTYSSKYECYLMLCSFSEQKSIYSDWVYVETDCILTSNIEGQPRPSSKNSIDIDHFILVIADIIKDAPHVIEYSYKNREGHSFINTIGNLHGFDSSIK